MIRMLAQEDDAAQAAEADEAEVRISDSTESPRFAWS